MKDIGGDFVVGVGGGSAIDAAKGIAVTTAMGGETSKEYLFGAGTTPFPGKVLPLFAVPTTCGTGSEISPAAVITDPDTHYKHLMLNCTPNVAILDPNLVAKMPAPITAATGMDALTHAIEAYNNPGNTPFTRMFATRAIQQISKHLRTAVNGPDRPAALKNMLYAADIAGQSMAQGLGQVHGLSHVVSGRLGTPHGVANAILLSEVLDYHQEFLADNLLEIAPLMGINAFGMPADKAGKEVVAAVRSLRDDINDPVEAQRCRDEGVRHPAVRRGRAEVAGDLHRRAEARHGRGPVGDLQEPRSSLALAPSTAYNFRRSSGVDGGGLRHRPGRSAARHRRRRRARRAVLRDGSAPAHRCPHERRFRPADQGGAARRLGRGALPQS